MRYRDVWCDDGMEFIFFQAALDQYCRSGTELFQVPSLAKESQFSASVKANYSGSAILSGEQSGKKGMSDAVVVNEADEED